MTEYYEHDEDCYRCHANAWELFGEFIPHRGPPQDVIICVFCGVRLRVDQKGRRPRAEPLNEAFRFQFGRFKGMTFAEADAQPNGRRYLEHLRDTNDKLRERIEAYLTSIAAPSA